MQSVTVAKHSGLCAKKRLFHTNILVVTYVKNLGMTHHLATIDTELEKELLRARPLKKCDSAV